MNLGEKGYNDNPFGINGIFSSNPYKFRTVSPYGYYQSSWVAQRPRPDSHSRWIRQVIALNNKYNSEAQSNINAQEPRVSIWDDEKLDASTTPSSTAAANDQKQLHGKLDKKADQDKSKNDIAKDASEEPQKTSDSSQNLAVRPVASSKRSSFRKMLGMKTSEEKEVVRAQQKATSARDLREKILIEERGRWPDEQWRYIVTSYQEKVGMLGKIADLRNRQPIQYLHLLKAGYFEPIPVAWADQASNPLKFSIESTAGWRGITPAWRGYEDTAEERLYWVLNHREGAGVVTRMKPDFISEMNMAMERMSKAVAPPPEYYSANDTCHLEHTSEGYSKQVMPAPFVAYDQPEVPTDDTMILLDVSGSMDFDPVRPIYNQYLVTGFTGSTQPKNKGKPVRPVLMSYY